LSAIGIMICVLLVEWFVCYWCNALM